MYVFVARDFCFLASHWHTSPAAQLGFRETSCIPIQPEVFDRQGRKLYRDWCYSASPSDWNTQVSRSDWIAPLHQSQLVREVCWYHKDLPAWKLTWHPMKTTLWLTVSESLVRILFKTHSIGALLIQDLGRWDAASNMCLFTPTQHVCKLHGPCWWLFSPTSAKKQ